MTLEELLRVIKEAAIKKQRDIKVVYNKLKSPPQRSNN